MNKLNADKYGVIGNPISHSKSPIIHSDFAFQTEQYIEYLPLLVPIDGFAKAIEGFKISGFSGANVTVPFKEEAWGISTKLSKRAELSGAVNTLSFVADEIIGDNTDGLGLINDLKNNHQFDFKDKSILVLGAGGAVRGVLGPIIQEDPANITVANRTLSKAEILKDVFSDTYSIRAVGFEALTQSYDLIINGTSASLNNTLPPVSDVIIDTNTVVYDMMYSNQMTNFNQWASSLGAAKTIDGLGMLVEQAAEAFYIWRGVRPKTTNIYRKLRES